MTTTFGEVTRRGDRFDLDFERVYATTVEDVWSAVTEPERLARWMSRYTGDLRLGGRWQGMESGGTVYCSGTVTACDPPRRYVTTWEYAGEGPSAVEVTVAPHPEGAVLSLRHTGLVDVDYGPGWQTYLEQLDGDLPVAPSSVVDPERPEGIAWDERFTALRPRWEPRIAQARGAATRVDAV
ncbi:SRPBCC family protein [Actinotalea sp. C106]|uniref:SRPBCC family protein n=1 Tax=Actinotalea sp. C106 TaxID=2908644 RepID=UPI00202802E5|nr:SRPBCC family protein [Actinotalea sp. C106]